MKEIYWRILLNTDKITKAEKFRKDILKAIPKSDIVSLEPYWKDKSLFCLELKQDLIKSRCDEIVFETLKIASTISSSWHIDLPNDFSAEDFDFSGVSESELHPNYISWISFFLQDKDVSVMDIV